MVYAFIITKKTNIPYIVPVFQDSHDFLTAIVWGAKACSYVKGFDLSRVVLNRPALFLQAIGVVLISQEHTFKGLFWIDDKMNFWKLNINYCPLK